MKLRKKNRLSTTSDWTTDKNIFLSLVPIYIFVLLGIISIWLIMRGIETSGLMQNLLIGFGTGAATSAFVSLIFYLNETIKTVHSRWSNRRRFMTNFKILFDNIFENITFDTSAEEKMSFSSYSKKQHRWFHEYYKRMIAGSSDSEETSKRVKQINSFIKRIDAMFDCCFEYGSTWQDSGFDYYQRHHILAIYSDYKGTKTELKYKNYKSAFLHFAFFIEGLSTSVEYFDELDSYSLLTFNSNGKTIKIDREEFYKREPFLKFADDFNKIRNTNYKKHYKGNE